MKNRPEKPYRLSCFIKICLLFATMSLLTNIICDSIQLRQKSHIIPTATACIFNALFLVLCLVALVYYSCCRKNLKYIGTFFKLNFLIELSAYPQLLVSAMLLKSIDTLLVFVPFVFSSVVLFCAWVFRLTIVMQECKPCIQHNIFKKYILFMWETWCVLFY